MRAIGLALVWVFVILSAALAAFCCKDCDLLEWKCWTEGTCCKVGEGPEDWCWYIGCSYEGALYCPEDAGGGTIGDCCYCDCPDYYTCNLYNDSMRCAGTVDSCECKGCVCINCTEYYGTDCGYGDCASDERPVWSCSAGTCVYTCEEDPACAVCGNGICEAGEYVTNCKEDCCEDDCTAVYDATCHSECDGYNGCDLKPGCDGVSLGGYACCGLVENQYEKRRQCCEGDCLEDCGTEYWECTDYQADAGVYCARQYMDYNCSAGVCQGPLAGAYEDCDVYTCDPATAECTTTPSVACGAACENDCDCEPYEYCYEGVCEDLRDEVTECDYYDYCSEELENLDACQADLLSPSPTYEYCKLDPDLYTNEEMWEICKNDDYAEHYLWTCP